MLYFTNPGEERHKNAILTEVTDDVRQRAVSSENGWNQLSVSIAEKFATRIIGEAVIRENYLLFSMCKLDYKGEEKYLTLGVMGFVIVLGAPDSVQTESGVNN